MCVLKLKTGLCSGPEDLVHLKVAEQTLRRSWACLVCDNMFSSTEFILQNHITE